MIRKLYIRTKINKEVKINGKEKILRTKTKIKCFQLKLILMLTNKILSIKNMKKTSFIFTNKKRYKIWKHLMMV